MTSDKHQKLSDKALNALQTVLEDSSVSKWDRIATLQSLSAEAEHMIFELQDKLDKEELDNEEKDEG